MDTARLSLEFKPEPMREELKGVEPGEWLPHYSADDYEGSWDVAPLMSVAGDPMVLYAAPTPGIYRPTPLLGRCPYFASVIEAIPGDTFAARLMRLGPGSKITAHADSAMSLADGFPRLHIPIVTSAAVDFVLDGTRVEMGPGECWYLNFNLVHSVHNRGDEPRTHLVIDAKTSDELVALF